MGEWEEELSPEALPHGAWLAGAGEVMVHHLWAPWPLWAAEEAVVDISIWIIPPTIAQSWTMGTFRLLSLLSPRQIALLSVWMQLCGNFLIWLLRFQLSLHDEVLR